MNHIEVKSMPTPYDYEEHYWVIDGKSLPEYLEEWVSERPDDPLNRLGTLLGLCPAWLNCLEWEGDVRFVWELISMEDAILPLLVCEDDLDFSCIVIVAEVHKEGDYVHWKRIGQVLHDNEDFEEEKQSGILKVDAYTDEDWEMYGDNIALETIHSEAWDNWIGENWSEELFRRRMNYTLPYYATEGNIRWLKDVNWTFHRREYEEVVETYKNLNDSFDENTSRLLNTPSNIPPKVPEKLYFPCKACGKPIELNKDPEPGFSIIAYDEMLEWSDFTKDVPPLNENIWCRSEALPKKGEKRIVKAHFPFHFQTGEVFWTLFQPAQSFFNGWDEHPEELDKSGIVSCRFESILEKSEECAWIEVTVTEVIALKDISSRFPVFAYDGRFDWLINNADMQYEYKNWTFYSWSAQGDLGEWILIYKDKQEIQHIILYSKWDYHASDLHCGNIIIRS